MLYLRLHLLQEYHIACNWKVFCNNYLDGGYHVPFAHGDLAAGIDMGTCVYTLHCCALYDAADYWPCFRSPALILSSQAAQHGEDVSFLLVTGTRPKFSHNARCSPPQRRRLRLAATTGSGPRLCTRSCGPMP